MAFLSAYCLRQSPSRPDSLRCLPVHLDRWPSRHTTHLYSSFERLNRWRFPFSKVLRFFFSGDFDVFIIQSPTQFNISERIAHVVKCLIAYGITRRFDRSVRIEPGATPQAK